MRLSDIPKVNFWPYDLFGYMLPGATFLTALALGESRASCYLQMLWGDAKVANYVLLAFLAYVTGTCISAISSLLIEANFLQWTFQYPTSRLFPTYKRPENRRRAAKIRWWKRCFVYGWLRSFGHAIAPKYCNAYPEPFQRKVKETYRRLFNEDFDASHTRFWLCWAYISLHHPAAYRRGSHFVELYGFSRNTCVSFLLIALLPIFGADPFPITRWTLESWKPPIEWHNWTGPSLVIALFFFANYLKLFKRMDDEMFHAFLAAAHAPAGDDRSDAKATDHFE